jgi:hypothetical protein
MVQRGSRIAGLPSIGTNVDTRALHMGAAMIDQPIYGFSSLTPYKLFCVFSCIFYSMAQSFYGMPYFLKNALTFMMVRMVVFFWRCRRGRSRLGWIWGPY